MSYFEFVDCFALVIYVRFFQSFKQPPPAVWIMVYSRLNYKISNFHHLYFKTWKFQTTEMRIIFNVVLIHICLRNRTTLRVDFLHSFMVWAQTYAFLVQGYQQKCYFSALPLHFCLPFGFVFIRMRIIIIIRMRSWESWNSRILCIK